MASHSRKPSSRAELPRRITRGPLDEPDPLSASSSQASSMIKSPEASNPLAAKHEDPDTSHPPAQPTPTPTEPPSSQPLETKDLSFLLDPSIYHPLSQIEIPGPLRRPFSPPPPSTTSSLSEAQSQITSCLSIYDFLGAAHHAGLLLTSNKLQSTDTNTIFRLLSIRYACLELSGNVTLAAQEAKALEDIGSTFYFTGLPEDGHVDADEMIHRPPPQHIMPFALRLQAVRLQSIGFSDPRRGVSTLYDLATECRENIASPALSAAERQTWAERLQEVGIRVVNALIEMGELDAAKRTLDTIASSHREDGVWVVRKAMICLKMGLLEDVRWIVDSLDKQSQESLVLRSLVAIAEDKLEEAGELLGQISTDEHSELSSLALQNYAVALLYQGEIQKARSVLDDLVTNGNSYQALTINLATVYDLSSDKSRDLKISLAGRVAAQRRTEAPTRGFANADFKL